MSAREARSLTAREARSLSAREARSLSARSAPAQAAREARHLGGAGRGRPRRFFIQVRLINVKRPSGCIVVVQVCPDRV